MNLKLLLHSILLLSIATWVRQPVVMAQTDVDLAISVTTDIAIVPINSNFTYAVTIENLGTDTATFVTVTDNLPAGITFLTSPDNCTVTGSTVTCNIGDLLAGEVQTLHYVVRANMAGLQIDNNVSVLAAETEILTDNNLTSASIDVVVPENVDLSLSGTVSATTFDISDEVTLSLTLTNLDMTDAYHAGIEFVLPSQIEFIASDDCSITGAVVSCRTERIAAGTATTIRLILRAVSAAHPVTISAIAHHFMPDPDTSNNGTSLPFVINDPPPDSANLQFTMTSSSTQVALGEHHFITYTLINLGPNTATTVQITDELPDELTFIASDTCNLSNNTIICGITELSVNEVYTASVTVTANQVSDSIVSSASVAGDAFDPNLFNNMHAIALTSIDTTLMATATATAMMPTVTITPTMTVTATAVPAVQVISTQAPSNTQASAPAGESGQADAPANTNSSATSSTGTQVDSPLPDGVAPSSIYGWTRYESVDLIQVIGNWQLRNMGNASDGAYHEARDADALLRYPFEGDGFRIGYRSEVNGAELQVSVDGDIINVITTDALQIDADLNPVRQTFVTQPYWVDTGYHLVDLLCLADGAGSQGCNIDYIEVFIGPPIPMVAQPTPVVIADSETLVVVDQVELVSAPPTLAPTSTPVATSVITVDVIVSADLNANGQVDANEGIEGITVRAVAVTDNSLLTTSMTDASGFVRITHATTSDVILLIPALGESFYVRNRGQALNETWNLLLDPVNIPGLIP